MKADVEEIHRNEHSVQCVYYGYTQLQIRCLVIKFLIQITSTSENHFRTAVQYIGPDAQKDSDSK